MRYQFLSYGLVGALSFSVILSSTSLDAVESKLREAKMRIDEKIDNKVKDLSTRLIMHIVHSRALLVSNPIKKWRLLYFVAQTRRIEGVTSGLSEKEEAMWDMLARNMEAHFSSEFPEGIVLIQRYLKTLLMNTKNYLREHGPGADNTELQFLFEESIQRLERCLEKAWQTKEWAPLYHRICTGTQTLDSLKRYGCHMRDEQIKPWLYLSPEERDEFVSAMEHAFSKRLAILTQKQVDVLKIWLGESSEQSMKIRKNIEERLRKGIASLLDSSRQFFASRGQKVPDLADDRILPGNIPLDGLDSLESDA